MAYARLKYRGVVLNTRTRDMILGAEALLGWKLELVQGSYNRGGVSASAGTHDGGGAVDIRSRTLTLAKKKAVVVAMRRVGFAAWLRLASEGPWGEHIHCIAIGDAELSRGAENQVTAYKNGRNGLASNRADNATRAYVNVTWERYKASVKPVVPVKPVKLPAVPGPVIHTTSIKSGVKGIALGGSTLIECERLISFAKVHGAIKPSDQRQWLNATHAKNWALASKILLQAIKNIQYMGKLRVDGVFGTTTATYVDRLGYRVIING